VSRILCTGSCKVANGTLQGSIQGLKSLDVRNVDVSAGDDGIIADKGVRVRDSTVRAWGRCISSYYGVVIVENTDVTYCRWEGVQAYQNNAKVYGSTISGARQSGVDGRKVLIKDSTVTGNAYGTECNHPTGGLNRVCTGGPDEGLVCGGAVTCAGGICEHKTQCGDVNAWKRPVLRNSTCGTSTVKSSSQTTPPRSWGVCSSD
jgi:hypothetical protein